MATVTNIYGSGSPAIFTTVTKGPGGQFYGRIQIGIGITVCVMVL